MPLSRARTRRLGAWRAAVCSAVLVVLAWSGGPAATATPAPTGSGARPTAAPARTTATVHYLALGDSLAAGYQPAHGRRAAGNDPQGGYVGVVASGLPALGMARLGDRVRVTNLGCTGETSATMVGGGRCGYRGGSQLAAARTFLRAHPDTALVTLTIGANDVRKCLTGSDLSWRCTDDVLDALDTRMALVLDTVRTHAPSARVVVTDYYNPYLAARLTGRDGRRLAIASNIVHSRLNAVIRRQAADHGARTARVAAAFDSQDITRIQAPGIGRVPRNVARICEWTWMCRVKDIHPDEQGYAIMGRAVLTRLSQKR